MSEKKRLFIKCSDGRSIERNTSEGVVKFVDGLAANYTTAQLDFFLAFSKGKFTLVDEEGAVADAPTPEAEQAVTDLIDAKVEEALDSQKKSHNTDMSALKDQHTAAIGAEKDALKEATETIKGLEKDAKLAGGAANVSKKAIEGLEKEATKASESIEKLEGDAKTKDARIVELEGLLKTANETTVDDK